MGSTFVARRAGTKQAASATIARIAPLRKGDWIGRADAKEQIGHQAGEAERGQEPDDDPMRVNFMLWLRIWRRTSPCFAPSAMRMPISWVRWPTR